MKPVKVTRPVNARQMMMAVAMTAFVVGQAWGASPRTESNVSGDNITVGDIFDGVTSNADYVLAPSPAPGKSVILNAQDLARVSDTFNLGWHPAGSFEQVVIRRISHDVGRDAVEAALQEKLAVELKGQKFEIQLNGGDPGFHLPDNIPATAGVSSLKYDLSAGDFRATISVPAGTDSPFVKKDVTGRLFALTSVPVLKNALRPGDVISANDIDYADVRNSALGNSVIVDAQKLVGQTPRRGVSAFKPLTASDIIAPAIVKKGDTVTMLLQNDILQLTTQGKALDNAALGETVHVINSSSSKVIEAVVTAPRTVTVQSPSLTLTN